ncbi:MAG: circularly permuted type 2 ATP-grasp protein [Tepidisphaeraceae bacterium]
MTDVAETPTAQGFAQSYEAGASFDEMVEPDGSLRAHWRMFVSMLDDLGPDELQRRWVEAKRLIHDNGITHNVYGDASGLDRPWNLDAVPLLTEQAAWDSLAEGLQQRAMLLDLLLADLYGPRRTIAEGVLPAELVYTSPAFLRPCHGIHVPNGRGCIFTPPTSFVRPAAGTPSSATARKPRSAPATRWKTASSSAASCRTFSASATCSAWRRSSCRCGKRWRASRLRTRTTRASSSSRPGRTARRISNTATSPVTSATRSCRATTSPFVTPASTSRRSAACSRWT